MLLKLLICAFTFSHIMSIVSTNGFRSIEINPELNLIDLEETPYAFANKDFINVVAFVDADCNPCEAFLMVWNELPSSLWEIRDKVKVSIIDCTIKKKVCLDYGVTVVPNIRYYSPRSNNTYRGTNLIPGVRLIDNLQTIMKPIEYDNIHYRLEIQEETLKKIIIKEMSESRPKHKPSFSNITRPAVCVRPENAFPHFTLIQNIDSYNVHYRLLNQSRIMLVGFYDMLCKPSKTFVDNWNRLALEHKDLRQNIIFASVNCLAENELCGRFFVSACPSIYYIPEYSPPTVGIPILTNLHPYVMMNSIYKEIERQQMYGKARSLEFLTPYRKPYITKSLSLLLLLADDYQFINVGMKLVTKYKYYIRYTIGNAALNSMFQVTSVPTIVFLRNGTTMLQPIPLRNDINYNIRTIDNVLRNYWK